MTHTPKPITYHVGQWVRLKKLVSSMVYGNQQAHYKAGEQVRIFSMLGYWATFDKPGMLRATCHTSNFEPVAEPASESPAHPKLTKVVLLKTEFDSNVNDMEAFCTIGPLPQTHFFWVWKNASGEPAHGFSRSNPLKPTDDPFVWLATDEQLEELSKAKLTPAQPQAPAAQPGPAPAIKPGSFVRVLDNHFQIRKGEKLEVIDIDPSSILARIPAAKGQPVNAMHRLDFNQVEPWSETEPSEPTERQQALFHDKGDPKIIPSELRDPTKTIYPTPTFRGMTATQVLDFLREVKKLANPPVAATPADVESVKQYAINLFAAGLVSTFSKAVDAGCIPPDLFPICRNIVVDHAREFLNSTTKTK